MVNTNYPLNSGTCYFNRTDPNEQGRPTAAAPPGRKIAASRTKRRCTKNRDRCYPAWR